MSYGKKFALSMRSPPPFNDSAKITSLCSPPDSIPKDLFPPSFDRLREKIRTVFGETDPHFRLEPYGPTILDYSRGYPFERLRRPSDDPNYIPPEDLVLHMPKGTRTRAQCIEVLLHPRTVRLCNARKAGKKEARRLEKCTIRTSFEAQIKAHGGTVGKQCKAQAHYSIPAREVRRRSEGRAQYNANVAYCRALVNCPPTKHLPSIKPGSFRKGADRFAYEFTLGQILPGVDLTYTETSRERYPEVACTWAGHLSYWERDFDIGFALNEDSSLTHCWQLQCKGTGQWFRPLYRSLASTDYARYTSKPFLVFYRLFRRMAHFAIRHFVNELQCDYQSRGDYLPILYLSYKSLRSWLDENVQVDTASELFELYAQETITFWNRFEELFSFVFPEQWSLLELAGDRARKRCALDRQCRIPLSAEGVAPHFRDCLEEVKAEADHLDDREILRARFNFLTKQINDRYYNSRMSREQALDDLLPRSVLTPKKINICLTPT